MIFILSSSLAPVAATVTFPRDLKIYSAKHLKLLQQNHIGVNIAVKPINKCLTLDIYR